MSHRPPIFVSEKGSMNVWQMPGSNHHFPLWHLIGDWGSHMVYENWVGGKYMFFLCSQNNFPDSVAVKSCAQMCLFPTKASGTAEMDADILIQCCKSQPRRHQIRHGIFLGI